MSRFLLLIALLGFSIISKAQVIDTVEIGYDKAFMMFFDKKITKITMGNPDVNMTHSDYDITLTAKDVDIAETNMIVRFNGYIAVFDLVYSDNPSRPNEDYYISKGEYSMKIPKVDETKVAAIKNGVDLASSLEEAESSGKDVVNEVEEWNDQAICEAIHGKKPTVFGVGAYESGVTLQVLGLYTYGDKSYVQIEIVNGNSMEYEIDFISFFVKNNGKLKRTAVQEKHLSPLYIHNEDKMLLGRKEGIQQVFAFNKISIDSDKRLAVEMGEKGGDKSLVTIISPKEISKSKLFKG